MSHLKIDWKKLMIRVVCVLCVICLLLTMFVSAVYGMAEEVEYETVEVQEGTLIAQMTTNVRQGPGTNYEILKRMKPGQTCIVKGGEGDWLEIEFDGVTGYIAAEYIEVRSYTVKVPVATSTPEPTAEPTPVPTETPMPGYEWVEVRIGTVNAQVNVNIRKGPGTEHGVLMQMAPGDTMTLTEDAINDDEDAKWYQVLISEETGYIAKDLVLVTVEMVQRPIPTPVPTETPAPIEVPTEEPAAVETPVPTPVPEAEPGYEWVDVMIGTLNAEGKINIREEANQETEIVGHMSPGDTCEIVGQEGDWYQIIHGTYKGYIAKQYVEVSSRQTQRPIPTATPIPAETAMPGHELRRVKVGTVIAEANAAIRTQADASSEIMTYIAPGKDCFVLDDDMQWYKIRYGGYVGFIAKEYLLVEQKVTQVPLITPSPVPTAEPSAAVQAPDIEYEEREMTVGTVISQIKANVRSGAGAEYGVLIRMKPGDTCYVLGEEGDWYRVEVGGDVGYISKDLIETSRQMVRVPVIAETPAPAATEVPEAMPGYEWVEKQRGTLIARQDSNLREGPGTDYRIVGKMRPGDVCQIIRQEGDWYHVDFNGAKGCILAELIETSAYMELVEIIVEDPLNAQLVNLNLDHTMARGANQLMTGVIFSNIPLTGIQVSVFDRRDMVEEMNVEMNFAREEQVYELDLTVLEERLKFRKLTSGEKRMTMTVYSTSDEQLVLDTDLLIFGETDGLMGITDDCELTTTVGRADRILDNRDSTAWIPEKVGDILAITAPSDATTDTLVLEWNKAPASFELRLDGTSEIIENPEGLLRFNIPTGGAARMTIRATTTDAGLTEARVYAQGRVPDMVQNWQTAGDKVDMMVIAAHPGDEFLFFGGAIPQAVMEGKNVLVVYVADCGFERMAEAMDGLWSVGVTTQPVCLGMKNGAPDDYDEAVAMWGLEESYEALVEVLRKYKPDVVLTHDVEGENGDEQHKLTSFALRRAVLLATDPEIYPASAQEYGVWDVLKTYIHRYEGNVLAFDPEAPVEALRGWSLREMTELAYSKYLIVQDDFDLEDGEEYSPYSYGVVRSVIEADDVEKNAFFENIGQEDSEMTDAAIIG